MTEAAEREASITIKPSTKFGKKRNTRFFFFFVCVSEEEGGLNNNKDDDDVDDDDGPGCNAVCVDSRGGARVHF